MTSSVRTTGPTQNEPDDTRCARCRNEMRARFRFCPLCGLPRSGGEVLSTQIREVREAHSDAARPSRRRKRDALLRAVLLLSVLGMVGVVAVIGLGLFSPRVLDRFFPPPSVTREKITRPPDWAVWIKQEPGTFEYGGPEFSYQVEIDYEFSISAYEVRNQLWLEFLLAREKSLRNQGMWSEAFPGRLANWEADRPLAAAVRADELDLPVRNISYGSAVLFCEWLTERLGEPGIEVRLPTDEEWEYVARGPENRAYPWGDEFYTRTLGSGDRLTARGNINWGRPYDVDKLRDDVTPSGVMGMGSNVEEWVTKTTYEVEPPEVEGGPETLVPIRSEPYYRGGATYNTDPERAEDYALVWKKKGPAHSSLAHPTLGIRLVKARVRPH